MVTMLADYKQMDKRVIMKNQNRSAALGWPAMKLLVGGGGGASTTRPTLALSFALVSQTLTCSVCVQDSSLINVLS